MKRSIFIILFLFFSSFLFLIPLESSATDHLLITEVQIAGQSSSNDFVEIYNPGDSSLDISGYKLRKRAKTGSEYSVRVFPEGGVIPANGYFLWANTKDGYNEILGADVASSQTLAKNNSLALLDSEGNVLDRLAWGSDLENPFGEGAAFPKNPEAGQSLERKFLNGDYQDTNDNANDFILNDNPSPRGSGGEPSPPEPVCQPAEEICDGVDNDCDDLIDEDLGETTCGIGACEVRVESCINGISQVCSPGIPAEEICDQIDNDCDGQIDEDGVCEPEPEPEPEPIFYPSGVFINEFLPSPEGSDAEEEWIEFYNSNSFLVNLSGWSVEDTQGRTKSFTFPEATIIESDSFFVLNRPTSKIVLNNDGEGLVLLNPLRDLASSVLYEGKAAEGQSYARKTDGIWQWTSALTPGGENSFPAPAEVEPETEPESSFIPQSEASEDKPEPQMEPETAEEPQSSFTEVSGDKPEPESPQEKSKPKKEIGAIAYPSGIVINEILPSPTGPDKENEWIEVFNFNNFEVNLSNWQIQDTAGRTKTYTFSKGTEIGPQGFLVLSRPTTKITLNNDGDGLSLIQPDGKIIDSVTLGKAPEGQSYNRTDSGWAWSATLTPGSANIVPAQAAEEAGEKEEVEGATEISEKGLAAIGRQFPTSPRSLFVLLSALTIAILSGIVILILKKKIKTE